MNQTDKRPAPLTFQAIPAAMVVAMVVFLMIYGVELATFSLSIDEEVATFTQESPRAWLSQGRWGMALLTLGFPEFEAIPFLSTALFGLGLLLATHCAIRDFRLGPAQAVVFAVLHVGFPVWLHVAQFSTLAGGFGIGLAAAAYGSGLAMRARGWRQRLLAVACIMFAIAVYQTLVVYAACYLLFVMHGQAQAVASDGVCPRWRFWLASGVTAAASVMAALVLYALVQRAGLSIVGIDMQYVGGFIQADRLQADPVGMSKQAFAGFASYLSGGHAIFIDWGERVWLLAWLGLLPWSLSRGQRKPGRVRAWAWRLLTVLLALTVVFAPFLMSAGYLPARAHVAIPLLAAWLASQLLTSDQGRLPAWLWVVLAYVAMVLASIGQSMFYADRVARGMDESLTAQLLPAIHHSLGEDAGKPFDITLVGSRGLPERSAIRRAEVFGNSFYEHDGGNPARLALYLGFHGVQGVGAVPVATRPDLLAAADTMPSWPAEGAVRRVNGVVIIKLGEPSYQQLIGK